MKLKGIFGKGSGKVGASVWAVSGGEQIVREYNPTVSNPNTEAQVAQRAKMKLMSQLASVLAPALGFTKQKLVSARNQFVSKNISLCTFENNEARVDVAGLQLTPSNVTIPQVSAQKTQGNLSVKLESAASADIKRVAYFVYELAVDNQIVYKASKIVDEAGEGRDFPTTFANVDGAYVIYAYGIKDNNVDATLRYEDYVNMPNSETADLSVVSLFRTADYGLTKTTATLV